MCRVDKVFFERNLTPLTHFYSPTLNLGSFPIKASMTSDHSHRIFKPSDIARYREISSLFDLNNWLKRLDSYIKDSQIQVFACLYENIRLFRDPFDLGHDIAGDGPFHECFLGLNVPYSSDSVPASTGQVVFVCHLDVYGTHRHLRPHEFNRSRLVLCQVKQLDHWIS